MAAISLSDRVATERGELVGETVGVAIRFINKFSEQTMIKVKILRVCEVYLVLLSIQLHKLHTHF